MQQLWWKRLVAVEESPSRSFHLAAEGGGDGWALPDGKFNCGEEPFLAHLAPGMRRAAIPFNLTLELTGCEGERRHGAIEGGGDGAQ